MAETIPPITDFIDRWAREKPTVTAVSYGERSWTWGLWRERMLRNAAAQRAAGLVEGERIAFLDKNNPACLETTLGCALTGTANAVINYRLSPSEISYIINDSRARLLMIGAEFVDVVKSIRDSLESVETIVVIGGNGDQYEGWLAAAAPAEPERRAHPDECFLQLYTSGTTGHPKAAMLTHRSLAAHNAGAVRGFRFSEDMVSMVAMPLFHVGGTSWAIAGMSVGGHTVVVREVVPPAVLDEIVHRKVTHAFFVPAVYGFFLDLPDVATRDYSALRCLGYGGSPMPLPLMRRCLATWDADFYQVYGMTEMSGVFSVLGPADHRDATHPERLVSAGHPLPGVVVKVVDPATRDEVPVGETGEFWLQSQQHMLGYWNNTEATAEALPGDDWLRSGDGGRVDADGYLFIEDRVKDMIISGGENVYPAEVERVLVEHPAVAEVTVIGIPDSKWGEQVKAVVVLADDVVITETELIAYARKHLAGYKCPKSVDFVAALPRSATGKVLKRELRKKYWEGVTLHG
jgi:acyl-CoA synthetase (AMP-forming)/AMP-acid ligase II